MGVVEPITSPTFTLVAEHRPPSSAPVLYHIDLYRLESPVIEALSFGLDEYLLGNGICVIEWADRVGPALPAERLWITLHYLDVSKRGIVMSASGPRYDRLIQQFRQSAFGV
jgi:tRNA threonylcarbamoyladenosine biosynthesis protein TsaE